MEYKKIDKKNYTLNVIKTDRFKTIDVTAFFTNNFTKERAIKAPLVSTNLMASTQKHKNINDIDIYTEELYGADVSASFSNFGNSMRLRVSVDFLEPKYTENKMLKKTLEFFKECLLNPNIEDGGFNKEIFDINKNTILNKLKNVKDNINSYSNVMFNNKMFEGLSTSFDLYNEYDAFTKITPKEVYEFYLEILSTWKIDVFLVGNISESEEKEYTKEIDKIFSLIDNNFNNTLTLRVDESKPEFKEIIEPSKFSQSGLGIGYRFIDLTEYERKYVVPIYNAILGGVTNSLLFTDVREKNSLCYSVGSYFDKYPISLIVHSKISKANYEKTIEQINKTVSKMKKRSQVNKLFKSAKENINTSINSVYDSLSSMVENYYYGVFDSETDVEERRKKYMAVKIKDVINLNKKLNKTLVYFLRGDKE